MAEIEIHRSQLIGQRIVAVVQGPWVSYPGDPTISSYEAYIRLANGICFSLGISETRKVFASEPNDEGLHSAELLSPARDFIGEKLVDVVACDLWPLFGLLLSSDRLLHYDCAGDVVALCVSPFDVNRDRGRYFSLWSGRDICDAESETE